MFTMLAQLVFKRPFGGKKAGINEIFMASFGPRKLQTKN